MKNEPVAWMFEKDGAYMCIKHDSRVNYDGGIPLYTHLAKTLRHENHDLDRGAWTVGQTESQEFIESSDFNHDVRLYLNGDFETDAQRLNYLQHIADRLNTHPAKTLTDEEIIKVYEDMLGVASARSSAIDFARAILRKAQEK